MKNKKILKCEVIDVKTESGVCSGMARVEKGESYTFSTRTPSMTQGMCTNSFCALSNSAFAMLASEKLRDEKEGSIDRVCPHGLVTYRLSREFVSQ